MTNPFSPAHGARTLLLLPLIIGGMALGTSSLMAQDAAQRPAPRPETAPANPQGPRDHGFEQHQKRVAEHVKTLHDALSLRPDQDKDFEVFIKAMYSDRRAEPGPAWSHDGDANLTTPQRLDRMIERQKLRQERLAKRAEAIKVFYAKLSPTQQKTFDALYRLHQFGMMHTRPFGHEGHGPQNRG